MISVVVPIHAAMKNGDFFLWRLTQSLMSQTYKDYELVIVQEGTMPVNTNAGLRKAKGELLKILYLDDYFAHPEALQHIVEAFKPEDMWLVSATDNNINPHWNDNIHLGVNTLGSPSALTMRNDGHLLFDENLTWLLDCLLYKKLYTAYGKPKILSDVNVCIGIHEGQMTNLIPEERKRWELEYIKSLYEENTSN